MEKDILEQMYRRHTKAVYLYLYSLCHNHALAEDLMQETFLRAFCSLETSGTEILPWLLIVARNLYLDTWRKEKHLVWERDKRYGEEERIRADESEETGKGILETMIQKEQNQRLYLAVQKLKSVEKEVVVLYYFAGLTQAEIAEILKLSYGNTRVILYRAKQNLKKMLDREEMTSV